MFLDNTTFYDGDTKYSVGYDFDPKNLTTIMSDLLHVLSM